MTLKHKEHTPIIGLYSDARGSGKSTAAGIIQDILAIHDWPSQPVPFAASLKRATCAFLEAFGLSDAEATRYVYTDKDTIIPSLGRTGREFLVKLGTDCGRDFVHPLCWVAGWKRKARANRDSRVATVCDDVRMPNEAKAIHDLGGVVIELRRPEHLRNAGDGPVDARTEGLLPGCTNYVVINDGTLGQLKIRLTQALIDARVIAHK